MTSQSDRRTREEYSAKRADPRELGECTHRPSINPPPAHASRPLLRFASKTAGLVFERLHYNSTALVQSHMIAVGDAGASGEAPGGGGGGGGLVGPVISPVQSDAGAASSPAPTPASAPAADGAAAGPRAPGTPEPRTPFAAAGLDDGEVFV